MDKTADIKKIRRTIEKSQDDKRFHHTLGVAYTATALAMRYDVDLKKAEMAGLLHDCARCMDNDKSLRFCKKYNISITDVEKRNPFLLHGKVGSYMAENKFHIQDEDVLNAILNHTTGRPGMSMLEKIVFIADYIEPSRKKQPNLKGIRKLAFEDIDAALVWILKDTLEYLDGKNGEIDPMTQKTYDYYCK